MSDAFLPMRILIAHPLHKCLEGHALRLYTPLINNAVNQQ